MCPVGFFESKVVPHKIHALYDKFIQTNQFHEWLMESQQCANIESVISHAKILQEKFVHSPGFIGRINEVVNLMKSMNAHKDHPELHQSMHELINLLETKPR